jgi:type IV secretory pathway protease TraF
MVLGLFGDTIDLGPTGIRWNGRPVPNGRALTRDSRGRPLVHYPYGAKVIGPDSAWLYSPYDARSYDSRYFGPVPLTSIRARIAPLLTFAFSAGASSGALHR